METEKWRKVADSLLPPAIEPKRDQSIDRIANSYIRKPVRELSPWRCWGASAENTSESGFHPGLVETRVRKAYKVAEGQR